ncbi:mitochondrial outer membrane protein [Sporothrix brasiliensis 5110]|uniref:DASH complex subunit DAD4 n=1 Tax=Sporothrix brasiliensis 5110 TaxID=1398154 RepID=A0A0C2IU67_9PEZI|nr:mitochondrial outer membrane protein [Sporothrix brasiliensis 5110]KIH88547.1 mitochondrial outer membrane protein [Sporothrix brasiliensis 5110]
MTKFTGRPQYEMVDFFGDIQADPSQESPHEHQQNLLLSRIITNVEKLNEAVMVMNKALQDINIQNMDVELVAQMFKNYRSNVLFHLEANALPGDDDPGLDSLDNDLAGDSDGNLSFLPTLYVFIEPADAARGRASFNPTCLKWQTFLRFADIPVRLAASSNHASPTGALPFLQPARRRTPSQPKSKATTTPQPPRPIPAHDFPAFVKKNAQASQSSSSSSTIIPSTLRDNPKAAAYQALLDTSLRRAWLHAVYLDETAPSTSSTPSTPKKASGQSIAARLYAHAASTSPLIRCALAGQLRTAAAAEVWGSSSGAQAVTASATAQLYRDAEAALAALSTLLAGEDANEEADGRYFFGSREPTLFDAAVFSYTHLLLEDDDDNDQSGRRPRFRWHNRVLPDMVRAHPRLVEHRDRIVARYWPKQDVDGSETAAEKTPAADTSASWIQV